MRWVLLPCLVFLSALPSNAQERSADEQLKALQSRVEALERLVVRDPMHPRDTVLARLDLAEDRLDTLEKDGDRAAKTDARDEDQLRRTLEALQNSSREMDRRLRSIEEQQRQATSITSSADLRDVRRQLDELDRSTDDLKDRVRRLEATR